MKIRKNRRFNRDRLRLNFKEEKKKIFDFQTIIVIVLIILLGAFIVKETFYQEEDYLVLEQPEKVIEKEIVKVEDKEEDKNENKEEIINLTEIEKNIEQAEQKSEDFPEIEIALDDDEMDISRTAMLVKEDGGDEKTIFEEFDSNDLVLNRDEIKQEVIKKDVKKTFDIEDYIDKDAPFRKFQQKVDRGKIKNKPVIAIIIDDVGLNKKRTIELINEKGPLTLSFLPYGKDLKELSKMARKGGHEVMLHAPMQPKGRHNAGPVVLKTNMSEEEIRKTAIEMMDELDGYVGVNNHMGSKFTTDEKAMRSFLKVVKEKGLLFVDSKTLESSVGDKVSEEMDIPYASRDVFIDHVIGEKDSLKQLELLEKQAIKYGSSLGIGHPHKTTISALKKWLPTLKAKGIEIVPISYIVDDNYARIMARKIENSKLSLKSDKKDGKN